MHSLDICFENPVIALPNRCAVINCEGKSLTLTADEGNITTELPTGSCSHEALGFRFQACPTLDVHLCLE